MMKDITDLSPDIDENEMSETRRLLPSPQSQKRISSDDIVSPRFSIDEGLRLKKWKEPTAQEKEFLEYVTSGDTKKVSKFLNENPEFNVNSNIDNGQSDGETALHVAVSRGDEDMVKLLLGLQFIQVSDCVLVAARDGRADLVMMLLDHVMYESGPDSEDQGCPGSRRFPEDVTPLMVAAVHQHIGLIRLLMKRNHQIGMPHPPSCFCAQSCRLRLDPERGLRASYERLRVYTALSSPAFICVTSDDPILRAFQLYRELRTCEVQDVALGASYAELARKLRDFAVELLACCRTNAEVELLLNRERGYETHAEVRMPRLLLAMEGGHKEFVAHPNTQHVLYTQWLGDSPSWGGSLPLYVMVGHVVGRVLLLPVLAVLNAVAPTNKWAKYMASPVNCLVNHVASYLLFLAFVFAQANQDKKAEASHGPACSGLEAVLALFLVSYQWSLFRLLYVLGFKSFFTHLWHCYDMVMMQLFWAWLLFWFHAVTRQEKLERKFWSSLHPALVSEGFLAVATILAFGRLLFLCQLHHKLGPMQVSLGKMTNDLAQCVVIFGVILLSFSAGLSTLFQYYDGMVQEQPGTGVKLIQPSSFVSLLSTMRTLFWGVFGLTPPEYAVVVIENLPDETVNAHNFTQNIGSACFALYMLLTTVMILNVLVAKMTNTFQKVVDNVDIEWTFGKTQLYMTYMQQTVMPPPLNLLPTLAGLSSLVAWLKSLCAKKADKSMEDEDVEGAQSLEYRNFMDELSKRFFHSAEETEARDPPSPGSPSPPAPESPPRDMAAVALESRAVVESVSAQLLPVLRQHNEQLASLREELLLVLQTKADAKGKR